MREDIKKLLETEKNNDIELRDELEGKVCAIDYYKALSNDIDSFDEMAWNNKTGYKTPNFPTLEKGLEGWSAGFYTFASPANAGKSALLTNILNDLCMCEENNLFGIYFSLDDSKNKIIPRIVAMRETLPISVISKPGRYQEMINKGHQDTDLFNDWLIRRKQGLQNLKSDSNKMIIFDSQDIKNYDQLYETVKNVHAYVKSQDENANIVIAIDSLKDVVISDVKLEQNERIAEVARRIKDISIEFNCIVLSSMHLRKLNGNRRSSIDDLKESNTLEYELDVCFLVDNDVSRNKQSAKIFRYESETDTEKKPVLSIDWAKNKISSYKGITFCNFSPEYSKCVEVTPEAAEVYTSRIYQM